MTRKTIARILLVAALVLAIAWTITRRDAMDVAAFEAWVSDLGAFGPVAFVLVYAAATVLFAPGGLLTIAGGALFGALWGTVLSLIGATLGATIAFVIARYLAGDWVARRTGGILKRLVEGIEQEGWRFVAFVRLVPLFPFNLLNYALGLTRISLGAYVVTSLVTMAPGGFAYAYLGYAGREAVAGGEGVIQKGLLALGLLAAIAFLPRLVRRLRKEAMMPVDELARRLDGRADILVLDLRDAQDFVGEMGHVPGAINIPLPDLEARLGELEDRRDKPLAVLCRTDKRTVKGVALLKERGFTGVLPVEGGMVEWTKRSLPVADRAG